MEKYNIKFKKSVLKDIQVIPEKDLRKILIKIKSLSENPRPFGCVKLSSNNLYRIRQGNYRILYSIEDENLVIYIITIKHRKNAYKM